MLTAETGRLELRGEEPPRYQQPFKYVIGMYDPEKKRVVILDQDRGVFPLVRSIKGMGDSGKSSALSKEQARDQLVSAFGSKRVRRTHQVWISSTAPQPVARCLASLCAHRAPCYRSAKEYSCRQTPKRRFQTCTRPSRFAPLPCEPRGSR